MPKHHSWDVIAVNNVPVTFRQSEYLARTPFLGLQHRQRDCYVMIILSRPRTTLLGLQPYESLELVLPWKTSVRANARAEFCKGNALHLGNSRKLLRRMCVELR
eukprot:2812663-Pyramimonas_sp.AAC.1